MLRVNFLNAVGQDQELDIYDSFNLKGFKVYPSLNGRYYTNIYFNPVDPNLVLPDVDAELIDSFSYIDRLGGEWVKVGLYSLDGAEAEVMFKPHGGEPEQYVSIKAPTFEELRAIYLAIRTNKLEPSMLWFTQADAPALEPELRES